MPCCTDPAPPVILAPRNFASDTDIEQIDCAVSPEIDSISLVEEAIATANRTGLKVRLVSLIEGADSAAAASEAEAGVRELIKQSSVALEKPELLSVTVGARGHCVRRRAVGSLVSSVRAHGGFLEAESAR